MNSHHFHTQLLLAYRTIPTALEDVVRTIQGLIPAAWLLDAGPGSLIAAPAAHHNKMLLSHRLVMYSTSLYSKQVNYCKLTEQQLRSPLRDSLFVARIRA